MGELRMEIHQELICNADFKQHMLTLKIVSFTYWMAVSRISARSTCNLIRLPHTFYLI